jgi:cyclophilin family peptidyl-prolyl cis-trans isomerase
LDGKHVVFGMILEGLIVVREVERRGTSSGQPLSNVTILTCGETPLLPARDQAPHYVTDWKV